MIRLTYDPELVEEAVLLAEAKAPPAETRAFRLDRDRIYDVADADEREDRFRSLHVVWFGRFGVHRMIEQAIAERPEIAGLEEGRVVRAVARREEGADLIDRGTGASGPRPMLVLRLQPVTFSDSPGLLALLRHELMHVSDMLDPAFGYQRTLPPSADGPSHENILRDRYRILWDVTIDGRLTRAGLLSDPRARTARKQEFASAFGMSDQRWEQAFDQWFDRTEPSHAALMAFALGDDAGGTRGLVAGRCPLCRFPVSSLDPHPERLSAAAHTAIHAEHPTWSIEQGICSQCLDLFQARSADAHRLAVG